MTIALRTFSSGKIVNENLPETPPPIDYKRESLAHPVPYIEGWAYRKFAKNEQNVRFGTVLIKNGWGEIQRQRRFKNRVDRNSIVARYEKEIHGRKQYYICVEFD